MPDGTKIYEEAAELIRANVLQGYHEGLKKGDANGQKTLTEAMTTLETFFDSRGSLQFLFSNTAVVANQYREVAQALGAFRGLLHRRPQFLWELGMKDEETRRIRLLNFQFYAEIVHKHEWLRQLMEQEIVAACGKSMPPDATDGQKVFVNSIIQFFAK